MSNIFEDHAVIGVENREWHRIFSIYPSQMRTFKYIEVAINLVFEAN